MNDKPLTNVCIITYNHENFISQTIEGILIQKTNFPIEIVIGEDCSTDRTKEICLEYQQKYPEIIRVLPREANLGMMPNFVDVLENCNGIYIALCEGDDYWTDPLKLQKQVDFLEANPDFSICFHRVKVIYEDSDKESYISNQNQKKVTTFEDMAAGNYIHTLSCVFRNNLFEKFPDWFNESPLGDYPLHLLNAQHGKIKFLEDVMGVYRVHQGGVWSLQNIRRGSLDFLKVVEMCKKHFAPRGNEQFSKLIANSNANLCFLSFENGEYGECRYYYSKCIERIRNDNLRMSLSLTLRNLLSYFPKLALFYNKRWNN